MSTIYLGLGANLGEREKNLAKALELLKEKGVLISKVSSFYETEPVGYKEQPWFLNMACQGKTSLSPFQLLSLAKEIEAELGRVPAFPYAPRLIDIDILFYDDLKLETESLTIPHPRIEERAFVLIPLAELSPEIIHPKRKARISDLLERLSDSHKVIKIGNVPHLSSPAF